MHLLSVSKENLTNTVISRD